MKKVVDSGTIVMSSKTLVKIQVGIRYTQPKYIRRVRNAP